MVGNPYRWKAVIPQLENRNATAGCLLSILFFLPLFVRYYQLSFLPVTLFVTIYVVIIVPSTTGILSTKSIARMIRTVLEWDLKFYMKQATFVFHWIHSLYISSEGIHVTTVQVVFNMAAEKVMCPEQRLSCLYVLLFYTVLAYLQRSLQNRPWTQLLNESSTSEFLKLTTAFIIVRLGKGVAMSMVLLTFTLQFNHLEPSHTYIALTFLYFCFTQYQNNVTVKHCLVDYVASKEMFWFEGMEEQWIPLIVNSTPVIMSLFIFFPTALCTTSYIVALMLLYTNIYVPLLFIIQDQWEPLQEQKQIISKFPLASWKNPQLRQGNSCAVCLDRMRILSARCTPCGHVFHGGCLRKCLLYSNQCPLCKHNLC